MMSRRLQGSLLWTPALLALGAPAPCAAAGTPMAYFNPPGTMGQKIAPLLWAVSFVAVAVVLVISALVLAGLIKGRQTVPLREVPLSDTHATSWISIGVGVSTIVLAVLVVWTSFTMAGIANPPTKPSLSIEIRAHQWWWEVHYLDANPSRQFNTANEIHIPAGQPVRFILKGMDVIHSFWIPSLGGKTDVIPGQTNVTWLEAKRPGTYRGQCSEYCGQQHAHMALAIIADRPEAFDAWRQAQIASAISPRTEEQQTGEARFILRCGACHRVGGTAAQGRVGPDLTHLMSRSTIAAGTLPNNPGYLSGWISNPQRLKPGALMPNLDLSGADVASIRSFLLTLK